MKRREAVESIAIHEVNLPSWRSANYIVTPDFKQLEESIRRYGILHPITLQSNGTLIDGFHRLRIAQNLGMREAPCRYINIDDVEAMLLHIELNRYRGVVIAKFLSQMIITLLNSGRYEYEELRKRMKLTREEFDVLSDGSLIKMRKIKQHSYSPAWIPIESKTGEDIQIERPTGHKEQV